ncbi:MAG: RNA polymerase sigma factor [Clostridiales bacterium]|nr:RNA polymerase sigma factor [Clostridiales bacterium]
MDDEELLGRIARSDPEAFHQFYRNTARSVYSFILSIARNPGDAEEIMQETYLKVWTAAGSYHPEGKPLAWVFTIARNLCYMKFREQKRQAEIGLDELSGEDTGEICPEVEGIADKMALLAAMDSLREEERQIVLLHAAAGLKHREIAENLGLPLATVLSKYNRAIRKIAAQL